MAEEQTTGTETTSGTGTETSGLEQGQSQKAESTLSQALGMEPRPRTS